MFQYAILFLIIFLYVAKQPEKIENQFFLKKILLLLFLWEVKSKRIQISRGKKGFKRQDKGNVWFIIGDQVTTLCLQKDGSYKTPILFFYSENNSDFLNRPPNTNLYNVHWFLCFQQTVYYILCAMYLTYTIENITYADFYVS